MWRRALENGRWDILRQLNALAYKSLSWFLWFVNMFVIFSIQSWRGNRDFVTSGTAQVFGWPRSEVGRTLHVAMVWGSWAHLAWKGCHRMSQGHGTNMVTWSHLPWRKLTELQFGLAQHHIETDSHGIILYIPITILMPTLFDEMRWVRW